MTDIVLFALISAMGIPKGEVKEGDTQAEGGLGIAPIAATLM